MACQTALVKCTVVLSPQILSTMFSATANDSRSADLFAELNQQQRQAVEHDIGQPAQDARPLLVIAGAGSGKTNTLAHRVVNLILNGADPQRILLLTFSRRAAIGMERRVGQV